MLVNKTAEHVIDHSAHSYYYQGISIMHYFFPKYRIKCKRICANSFRRNNKSENAAGKIADKVIANTDIFIIKCTQKTMWILLLHIWE